MTRSRARPRAKRKDGETVKAGGDQLERGAFRDPVWVVATVLFALLALSTLTNNGLWNDEWIKQYEFSAERAGFEYSSRGAHPLHHAVGRGVARLLGVGPYALRLPWALFAIGCIPLAYGLGREAKGRRLGRIAAVLMAASPYLLFYAQDANYYAEMMFFSLAAALAMWVFIESGSLAALGLGLLALVMLYLVHPFGAVCGGGLALGAVVGGVGSRPARSRLASLLRFRAKRVELELVKAALAVGILMVAWRSGVAGRAWREGSQFLTQFHLGGSYTNTVFNTQFIMAALTELGPSVVSKTPWTRLVALVYPALALLGLVALGRRKPWPTAMVSFVFALTGVVIFCFKIDRFFHLRYISYVVPLYVFAVAAGLEFLGERIERRLPGRPWVAWAPPLALLLAIAPPFAEHLAFDGAYMKKVEAHLEPRLASEDRVFTYQMVWPITPMAPAGISAAQHVEMPGLVTIGQGGLNAAFFKWSLVDHPASWLLHHWNEPRTIHAPLLQWADRWMTREVEAPSIFQNSPIQWYNREPRVLALPLVMAVLHRWDWPDRYVAAPRPLRIDLAAETSGRLYEFKRERGLSESRREEAGRKLAWKSPFLFEHAGAYRFAIVPVAGEAWTGATLKLNEQALAETEPLEGDPARGRVFLGEAAEGSNEIEFEIESAGGNSGEIGLPRLEIAPDFDAGFRVHPLFLHPPVAPSQYVLADRASGRERLIFKRNFPATYRLELPRAGRYCLTLEAIEDRPGPVLVDLVVDGRPEGLLTFGGQTGKWGRRKAIVQLTAGAHDLTFTFMNELDVMATEPDEDNDLIFGGFEVITAREEDRDERLALSGRLTPPPEGFQAGFAGFRAPAQFDPRWGFSGEAAIRVYDDRGEEGEIAIPEPGWQVLEVELEAGSKGYSFAIPPIEVQPGEALYFDCEMKTDVKGKHSCNVRIEYRDARGRPLGGVWARGTDVNMPTGWQRYAFFGGVPPGAVLAVLTVTIYPNSRNHYPPRGRFYFRRLRFIEL